MRAILEKNLAKFKKDQEEAQKLLASRERELIKLEEKLQQNLDALKAGEDNYSYLKRADTPVIKMAEFVDLKIIISFTREEVSKLRKAILDTKREIQGLGKIIEVNKRLVDVAQEELKKYGQVIPFPKSNNQ